MTFYKMLSYIYAFLLGAFQRVSLYHQILLHCIRKAESDGTGKLIMVDTASDSDSVQESISIREMKERENHNGEYENRNDDQDRPDSENTGFSLGTSTPGSTPIQAGRKQMILPDGGNMTSRASFAGSFQSPPIHGFATLHLEDDGEGYLRAPSCSSKQSLMRSCLR